MTKSTGRWHASALAAAAAGAAVGTYVCGKLGYATAVYPTGVSILWPAGGVLLATLAMVEREWWAAIIAGAIAGNALADVQQGNAFAIAVAGAAANALESMVGAWVLTWRLGRRIRLLTTREVGTLVLGVALATNAVTALIGALVLHAGSRTPYWDGWFAWWVGDGMAMLLVAPVVFTWTDMIRRRERLAIGPALEGLAVVLAMAIVAHLALRHSTIGSGLSSYPYLVFPFFLWIGVRYRPSAAASATLVLAMVTIWSAARLPGLFSVAGESPMHQVLEIYVYLGVAALSSLVPSAMLSERREVERRLRESEERFRQMAESIQSAFFVVDLATWQPLYVSPAWSEIWGRPLIEGYDREIWFNSIHPDDQTAMRRDQAAVQRGESAMSRFRIVRPDGQIRWLSARAFPIRDATGAVYRIAGVSEDVTAVRAIEERASESRKLEAVGELAGGIAHEFNNLLTVILGASEMVAADLPAQAPQRAELEAVREAAQTATQLTRELLAFSQRQVLQPRVVRLNEHIGRTSRILERLLGAHIRLVAALDSNTAAIRVDPASIEHVLLNLAVNAREAMPDGGALTISLANASMVAGASVAFCPPGEYVRLEVRDSGVGIPPDVLPHIFEPFFTTKRRARATGLGLATVRGIVEQNGGFIGVDSRVGQGTRFEIYFPAVTDPQSAAPALWPAGAEEASPTVLFVEDEGAVRGAICRGLRRNGFNVLEAANGELALTLASDLRHRIDLLVTDVVMPGMGGRELATRFSALRPAAQVLYVSGYTDDDIVRQAVYDASMHYLQKPFTPTELAAKIQEILGQAVTARRPKGDSYESRE